jgi:hypothetical protein
MQKPLVASHTGSSTSATQLVARHRFKNRCHPPPADLYRFDVLGAWAFWTTAFSVGHFLAFMQFVETDALQARGVEKQVFFLPCIDEPKALVR